MKKTCVLVMTLLMTAMTLCAAPYSDILEGAKANSITLKNAEISYRNSQITVEKNELKDEVAVTVSGIAKVSPSLAITPSVKVVLPNDGATTIEASVPYTLDYDDTSLYSASPSLKVSHVFDLSGYDKDVLSALSNSKSLLSSEYSYQNTILTFENSVLNSIRTLLSTEKSLASQSFNLEESEKSLNDKVTLGQVTEGSVTWQQAVNQINISKNTVSALERQIENAKSQYKTLTGLEWDGVTDLPEPDLTFTMLPGGNTGVIIKQIDAEIAKENYAGRFAQMNPQAVAVNGSVTGTNSRTLMNETNSVGMNAGATYSQNNWTLGSSVGFSYNARDNKFDTPSLTVSGTWQNKTTTKKDELELQGLSNLIISAENSAQDELTSYIQSARALELDIMQYEFTKIQSQANSEYLKANLENVKALHDVGLVTDAELRKAEFNAQMDEYDTMSVIIDGLILQNRIRLLNL
ncbi:MAG: TolC family protein [Bullifex sp.]